MAQRTPVTIDDEIELDSNSSGQQPGGDTKPSRDIPAVAGFEFSSPGDFIDGGTDDSPGIGGEPKRRGRPKGSRNGSKTEVKAAHNLADGLEKLLLSVHAIAGVFLHCPELELDPTEAKILSSSVRDLSKYYNVTLDPKKVAMLEFSTVLASIYGLRGVAIYKRMKNEKTKGPQRVATPIREQPKAAQSTTAAPVRDYVATSTSSFQPAPPRSNPMPTPQDYFGPNNGVEDLSQL